jgi:uncharacterized radical SAM superfamily Fe-S cluster-containing enzyme
VAVEGVDAEEAMKLEADDCAKAEDVLVEELMKTAHAHDIVGVKNEGDEEPTIDEAATSTEVTHTASNPTKASTTTRTRVTHPGKVKSGERSVFNSFFMQNLFD